MYHFSSTGVFTTAGAIFAVTGFEETALVSPGEDDELVVLVRELLAHRLDVLDYQSETFENFTISNL